MSNKGWTQQIGEQDNVTFAKESPLIITLDARGEVAVVSRAEVRRDEGAKPVSFQLYEENRQWIGANSYGSMTSVINAMLKFAAQQLDDNNLTLRVENRVKR